MESLPVGDNAPFVRTDFSDGVVWQSVCEAIRKPNPELQDAFNLMMGMNAHLAEDDGDLAGCLAYVDILDESRFADIPIDQILQLVPIDSPRAFMFVFDHLTASHVEHPILVIDLHDERGRTFRAIPNQIQSIENNLSVANMDWEDFADAVDQDGIFRGFGTP
jgi:hypothetical protein